MEKAILKFLVLNLVISHVTIISEAPKTSDSGHHVTKTTTTTVVTTDDDGGSSHSGKSSDPDKSKSKSDSSSDKSDKSDDSGKESDFKILAGLMKDQLKARGVEEKTTEKEEASEHKKDLIGELVGSLAGGGTIVTIGTMLVKFLYQAHLKRKLDKGEITEEEYEASTEAFNEAAEKGDWASVGKTALKEVKESSLFQEKFSEFADKIKTKLPEGPIREAFEKLSEQAGEVLKGKTVEDLNNMDIEQLSTDFLNKAKEEGLKPETLIEGAKKVVETKLKQDAESQERTEATLSEKLETEKQEAIQEGQKETPEQKEAIEKTTLEAKTVKQDIKTAQEDEQKGDIKEAEQEEQDVQDTEQQEKQEEDFDYGGVDYT